MDSTLHDTEATTAQQPETTEGPASAATSEPRVEEQLLGAWADVRIGLRTRKPAAIEAFVKDFKQFVDQYQTGGTALPIDDSVEIESQHQTHRWPYKRTELLVSVTLKEEISDEQHQAYSNAVANYCNQRGDVAWSHTGFNAFIMGRIIYDDVTNGDKVVDAIVDGD